MFTEFFTSRVTIIFLFLIGLAACKKNSAPTPAPTPPPAPVYVGLKNTLPAVLKESSGLIYTDNNLWSFGDSGNPNAIYRIDSATGAILQVVTLTNCPNTDYESITADSVYIYVGDLGNNGGDRKDLSIYRIKKADISPSSYQVNIIADTIRISYMDQTDFSYNSNTNFDCEAMLSLGSHLYIFSKDRGDLQTRCYKVPKEPGSYQLSPISTFNTNGKVTDAAYNPVTKELALLGYMNKDLDSFIWLFDNFTGDDFFSGASKRINIGNTKTDWQTEGLTYISGQRLMLSCETSASHAASLYFVQKQ